jgi:PAS domain S-box-containing protein
VIDLSRYVFEALRNDEELILYRGQSKDDTSQVLVLSPAAQRFTPESLRRLEHEYSLKEELDPSWAARPMAIASHWDRTVLVLEDPGGVPLDQLLGHPLDIALALRLAISLSTAIGCLHQRGLIHKDIKPAHVLVNLVTDQCWLMGFGIASRLPRERQSPGPPEFVAGTLAYMAPEQTGRMNRSIDSRSDLYALGVTLYEVVTGSLPFTASDPMEWVHCHIARQPIPPQERLKHVPASLSAIIMRLLAKTAEERYQTAAGAESDLRRCLAEWETQRRVDEFPLGDHDTPDRLLMPEKLHGRAREIDSLLASFERVVSSGKPELVLVSGYSGIGKSSVVNELQKVLVPPRGLFASGKFDQYKREIPYATLAQALQNLIRPLLSKGEAELQDWRDGLHKALGPNGRLIVDLVPELKLIIGEQPPVPDLLSQDAQGRFRLVFRRFIDVFARPEHPLALFLDDLQWLDAATFDLFEDLLTRPDVRHLMLIGAYRDNEVNSSHPLMRKLKAIRQAGAIVQEIILAPLTREELGWLIADSLHCEPDRVTSLAQLVHEKTAGNPFFAVQFISALADEALLTFDYAGGRWSWELSRIQAKGYTDNVADLMVGKLSRLPVETQKALQELACLGNSAEIATLSIVHGRVLHSQDAEERLVRRSRDGEGGTSEEEVHSDLWEAVRLEFLVRLEGSYKFAHDRFQEAAYSLVPEQLRAEAHLRIGRLLAVHTGKREEAIFEIVNQLNRGAALIASRDELERLAELNLVAGKRAKTSTAYASALKYLVAGAALLADDCWERRHELAFALELHRAECEFLTGQSAAAVGRLTKLSSRAANTVERATVAGLRVDVHTTLDQSDRAVGVCLDYLQHLGVEWSPHPTEEEGRREYDRIWSQLGSRAIEDLIELPLMSDPASLATLDVLTKVLPPALFTDANLLSLAICRAVNLSLERGNSDGSCVAYVWLGQVGGPHFGNYRAGFRFGRLGYELVEKRGLKRFQARTYMVFGSHVMPWTKHVRAGRDLLHRTFKAANKVGDLTFAAYSCINLNTNLLAAGDPLVDVQREAENGLEFARKAGFGLAIDLITAQLGLIRTLCGMTPKFGCFDDGQFDELRFERHLANDPAAQPECFYWIRKLQARFSAGDYESAIDASRRAQRLLWTAPSNFEMAEYHLYGALSRAASCDSAFPERCRQHFEALTAHHRQLEVWAENCLENFGHRVALVAGEIARLEGRDFEAMRLYEEAIRLARTNGFVHNEALADELAAHFYLARGFEKIAYAYLREARYCYLRWEAAGKVRQLDQLYPQLREEEPAPGPTSTIGASVEHLDLATVLKVSQAMSGEIVLEKLIDTLMRTAIEHAGAERGLLILPRGVEQRIEAEATTSGDTVIVRLREASMAEVAVPESIIHYVVRTRESVILDDASVQHPFSADTYIRQQRARSILCLPLINQAKLIGLLYLENNLAPHVFTPTRITVLKLLASQAAISLENTRLYRDLTEREARIRRLFDTNLLGMYLWNLQGEILEANEAFLHILGYSRADLVSGDMRWTDLTPPDWRDRDGQAQAELAATGTIQPFEKEYLRKDGNRVPVLLGCATFAGNGNEGVAFVLNLSKQKLAEDALHQTQAELARVSRMTTMEQLAASIAHEVNQPLGAVVTSGNACLNWLSTSPPNLRKARDAAERIVRDGNRASDVLKRVRALLKKAPLTKSPTNINEVIHEVLALVGSEMRKRAVEATAELDSNLPAVMADFVQLQQVLLNLVMNAIEAMTTVTERPRVLQIQSRQHDFAGRSAVLVAVRDSGVGLTADGMAGVFEAFYTTKPAGMGMGLWICRSIIEAHNGQLTAEPNDGAGATFQFILPLSAEDSA